MVALHVETLESLDQMIPVATIPGTPAQAQTVNHELSLSLASGLAVLHEGAHFAESDHHVAPASPASSVFS